MLRSFARIVVFGVALSAVSVAQQNWPQWRGPLATGVAPRATPPTQWSETENLRWKAEVPGFGHSTPIVWGDRVFVTTAIPFGGQVDAVPDDAPGAHDNAPVTQRQEFAILALARADGEVLWQQTLRKQLPYAGAHKSGSLASASPVTDGEHLIAFFGSHGIYCLDFDGELVWEHDLGKMQVKHGHGEGSSPVLHGDTVVVNWDHEGPSFLVAFDKRTGEQRWRVERDEVTSWSSPIVVEHGGKPQLIVNGTKRVRAHDLATGEVIWECGGLSHNVVASPVAAEGLVFVASSYEKRALLAIQLEGARGDLTGGDNILWQRRRRAPYVPSPLLYDGKLYFLNHYQGVLTRVTAKTGAEPLGPFRLPGIHEVYASPVAADGRIYITDRSGETVVLSHGDAAPEVLARNRLDTGISASLALVDAEIYVRGTRHLYCVAAESRGK